MMWRALFAWVVCMAWRASARELEAYPVPAGATNAIAVLTDGTLLLAGDSVALLDPVTRAVRWTHPLDEPATCAVALPAGGFLTATRRCVQVHAADGRVADAWAPLAENAWITSLAVGSNTVFVCDAGQRVVWRYALDGRLSGRIPPLSGAAPEDLFTVPSPCFDTLFADGVFRVVNSGAHEIRSYAPDGARGAVWGQPSMSDPAGFVGCCNPIHLAVMADGALVTAEKGLPRIKVYEADGSLRGLVAGADAFARGRAARDLAVDPQGRILVLDRDRLRVFEPVFKPVTGP